MPFGGGRVSDPSGPESLAAQIEQVDREDADQVVRALEPLELPVYDKGDRLPVQVAQLVQDAAGPGGCHGRVREETLNDLRMHPRICRERGLVRVWGTWDEI